jgi:predicted ribonuclease YlaK
MVGPDGAPSEPVRTAVTIEVLVSVEQHNSDADRSNIETCVELQQLAGQPNTVTLVTGDAEMRMRAAQRRAQVVAMPEDYLRDPD